MKGECAMSRTLELVSSLVRNFPEDLSDEMTDFWNNNPKALQRFLTGLRQKPVCMWREQDGIIYFSVTSNGMIGSQWIEHFEKKGIQLSKWAKDVLLSPDFKPTSGVITEVAVLKGMLFEDSDRVTSKIRAEADKRKLAKPEAEIGCLIRDMFTDEEIEAMGLGWIVAFHEPIEDSDGDPDLLSAYRLGDGPWLRAYCDGPDSGWSRVVGFAFAVSQVSL